jgi:hypothetical protein
MNLAFEPDVAKRIQVFTSTVLKQFFSDKKLCTYDSNLKNIPAVWSCVIDIGAWVVRSIPAFYVEEKKGKIQFLKREATRINFIWIASSRQFENYSYVQ